MKKETNNPRVRVAAYCRTARADEMQYPLQTEHYNRLVQSTPGWELVGIYADYGVSGTGTKERGRFQAMIDDALGGKIDRIITKSISRFSRNLSDCLTAIRQLRERGVGVTFESEGIDTLDSGSAAVLPILELLAGEEEQRK